MKREWHELLAFAALRGNIAYEVMDQTLGLAVDGVVVAVDWPQNDYPKLDFDDRHLPIETPLLRSQIEAAIATN
jgi:hypothetical protein